MNRVLVVDSIGSRCTDRLGQNGFEKAHVWESKIGGRRGSR